MALPTIKRNGDQQMPALFMTKEQLKTLQTKSEKTEQEIPSKNGNKKLTENIENLNKEIKELTNSIKTIKPKTKDTAVNQKEKIVKSVGSFDKTPSFIEQTTGLPSYKSLSGTLAGSALGTMLLPGIGTLLGGVAGGVGTELVSKLFGKKITPATESSQVMAKAATIEPGEESKKQEDREKLAQAIADKLSILLDEKGIGKGVGSGAGIDIDLPDRRAPKTTVPKTTRKPPIEKKPGIFSKVAEGAGRVAGNVIESMRGVGETIGRTVMNPLTIPAVAIAAPYVMARQGIEKIKEDPLAKGLESNPLAMQLRGEATTVGQAGKKNVAKVQKSAGRQELKDVIESKLTDDEITKEYGTDRQGLQKWLTENPNSNRYQIPMAGVDTQKPKIESASNIEGTLKNLTYEQIVNHPNYNRYYEEELQRSPKDSRGKSEAKKAAIARVRVDIMKEGVPVSKTEEQVSTFDAAKLAERDPETHAKFVTRQQEIIREREKELEGLDPREAARREQIIRSEAFSKAAEEFRPQAAKVGAASVTSVSSSTSGELSGITEDQITAHPNFKKYYEEAYSMGPKGGKGYIEAKRIAASKVRNDILREQTPAAASDRSSRQVNTSGDFYDSAPVSTIPPDRRGAEVSRMSTENEELKRGNNLPVTVPIVNSTVTTNNSQNFVPVKPAPRNSSSTAERFLDARRNF